MSGAMLTVQQVADCLRVSTAMVRRLVSRDDLCWEYGTDELISEAQLEDYINSCRADTAVYFIRMQDTGHVKIGMARDPQQRLSDMQTANPEKLELIAFTVVVNGRGLELALHKKLAPYRLNGEWFRAGEWLDALMTLTRKGPGLSERAVRKVLLG